MLLTKVAHVVARARRVEENLGRLRRALLQTHLDRALAITIAVDCEFDLISVSVPECLPKERNVFALVEEHRTRFFDVLRKDPHDC